MTNRNTKFSKTICNVCMSFLCITCIAFLLVGCAEEKTNFTPDVPQLTLDKTQQAQPQGTQKTSPTAITGKAFSVLSSMGTQYTVPSVGNEFSNTVEISNIMLYPLVAENAQLKTTDFSFNVTGFDYVYRKAYYMKTITNGKIVLSPVDFIDSNTVNTKLASGKPITRYNGDTRSDWIEMDPTDKLMFNLSTNFMSYNFPASNNLIAVMGCKKRTQVEVDCNFAEDNKYNKRWVIFYWNVSVNNSMRVSNLGYFPKPYQGSVSPGSKVIMYVDFEKIFDNAGRDAPELQYEKIINTTLNFGDAAKVQSVKFLFCNNTAQGTYRLLQDEKYTREFYEKLILMPTINMNATPNQPGNYSMGIETALLKPYKRTLGDMVVRRCYFLTTFKESTSGNIVKPWVLIDKNNDFFEGPQGLTDNFVNISISVAAKAAANVQTIGQAINTGVPDIALN